MPRIKAYDQKRNFQNTPEPEGTVGKRAGPLRFVVQKHRASHLHFDFRLEAGGVLKSWAVPKGPSMDPAIKRLAMMVEDHPLSYRTFEGIIPKGNYGAGSVMVWDIGTYHPIESQDPTKDDEKIREGIHKGHLSFILQGKKLHGEFSLIKMRGKEENSWILVKKDDEFTKKPVEREDLSVKTGRTLDEIAGGTQRAELDTEGAKKTPLPKQIKPMLATLVDKPFDSPDWIFEIKWDGYRTIAQIEHGQVRLYSRNNQDFTELFEPIARALESLGHTAVLDGEVIVVDQQGRAKFGELQNYKRTRKGILVYYVFDVLFLDGYDLRILPLLRRKELLKKLIRVKPPILLSDFIEEKGKEFFEIAKEHGVEGVIAKKKNSAYETGKRTESWLKIKSLMRQEVVIGGFTKPRGSRKKFGALVLGLYKKCNALKATPLRYVGHTGGGFDEQSLKLVYEQLEPLITDTCPFDKVPKTNMPATWVKPKLLAEVEFSEWTSDGSMRHPIFKGLREDKKPESAVQEIERKTEKVIAENDSSVPQTNRSKIFFSKERYTKGDLIDYYQKIGDTMLPYLLDRPHSLYRTPNGVEKKGFFQKDINFDVPPFVNTFPLFSDSEEKTIHYLVCENKETLLFMANLGCIEINPWLSTTRKIDYPTFMVMDLDPGSNTFDQVVETARELHEILEKARIRSVVKTSGKTGLHICIPLESKYSYEEVKQFANILALLTREKLPHVTSVERSPSKRPDKIYVDFLQNRIGQTIAAPYSVRPVHGAPVSTPLEWKEVKKGLDPREFTIKTIFKRLEKKGDLFTPVLGEGIDMLSAIESLQTRV